MKFFVAHLKSLNAGKMQTAGEAGRIFVLSSDEVNVRENVNARDGGAEGGRAINLRFSFSRTLSLYLYLSRNKSGTGTRNKRETFKEGKREGAQGTFFGVRGQSDKKKESAEKLYGSDIETMLIALLHVVFPTFTATPTIAKLRSSVLTHIHTVRIRSEQFFRPSPMAISICASSFFAFFFLSFARHPGFL